MNLSIPEESTSFFFLFVSSMFTLNYKLYIREKSFTICFYTRILYVAARC
jgi:hypothetical protein